MRIGRCPRGRYLNCDPLDFIERDLILPPVVELGRPRRLVVGEVLRQFELAAVLQVRGDAGRAEGVDHHADQRPVAQSGQGRFFGVVRASSFGPP